MTIGILDGRGTGIVVFKLGENTAEARRQALLAAGYATTAAEEADRAEDEADRAELYADQAGSARPYYSTVAAGAAAVAAPGTFLSDENDDADEVTLYDEAGNELYQPASRSRLDRHTNRARLQALIRGRIPRAKLGARNAWTSDEAPRAATITHASDSPASSNTWATQITGLNQHRRKVLSLTAAGAGAPNYCTVECAERHGLVAGARVRLGGTANVTSSGPSTEHNTLGHTADGGQLAKSAPTLTPGEAAAGYGLKGIFVYDVVDDFNFRVKQSALLALSETGDDLFWEPVAQFWPMDDPVFDWVIPGRREAIPTNQHSNATLRPAHGVVSWGTPEGLGGATENATSKTQSVEFMLYDGLFQLAYVQGYYRVFADGIPVHNGQLDRNLITFPGGRDTFDLGEGRPLRIRIDVIASPHHLFGIYTRNRNSIGPLEERAKRRPLYLHVGASFGEGSGAKHWHFAYAALFAEHFQWNTVNGSLGTTGMTTGGIYASSRNYIGRLKLMKAAGIEPDVIGIEHTVNDGTSVTRVNSTAFVEQVLALWPHVALIVFGRVTPNENAVSAGTLTADAAWKATARAFGIPFLDGGIGTEGPIWITAGNKLTHFHGTAATATASLTADAVTSASVTLGGEGYDPAQGPPVVSFSGGGGTGAAATAVMNYTVTDLQVTRGGTGYTTATATITHGWVTQAIISGGTVLGARVTRSGMLFNAVPDVNVTGDGTGATAHAELEGGMLKIVMDTVGSGYTTATFEIAVCASDATCTLTITGDEITGATLTGNGDSYVDAPIVEIDGDGYGAEVKAYISGEVDSITIDDGGSGYVSPPTMTIAHPHIGGSGDTTHPKSNGYRMHSDHYTAELELQLAA